MVMKVKIKINRSKINISYLVNNIVCLFLDMVCKIGEVW